MKHRSTILIATWSMLPAARIFAAEPEAYMAALAGGVFAALVATLLFEWFSNFFISVHLVLGARRLMGACKRGLRHLRKRRVIHSQARRLETEIYQFYRDSDDRP